MNFFSFKSSILISFGIHFSLLILWGLFGISSPSIAKLTIPVVDGTSTSLRFRFSNNENGKTESSSQKNSEIGSRSIQEEINRIQKSIQYPSSALERGLESDCEWIVTVAENRKLENVETSKKCRYQIFDSAFRQTITQWEFQIPKGSRIRIPVSFRILDKNE
jgi:TonB family protein